MTPAPTRTAPCGVCGRPVAQRATSAGPHAAITWWQPDAHTAPCGAPCAAGGVTGRSAAALADALARTHRATSCGTVGCGGGTAGAPRYVDPHASPSAAGAPLLCGGITSASAVPTGPAIGETEARRMLAPLGAAAVDRILATVRRMQVRS